MFRDRRIALFTTYLATTIIWDFSLQMQMNFFFLEFVGNIFTLYYCSVRVRSFNKTATSRRALVLKTILSLYLLSVFRNRSFHHFVVSHFLNLPVRGQRELTWRWEISKFCFYRDRVPIDRTRCHQYYPHHPSLLVNLIFDLGKCQKMDTRRSRRNEYEEKERSINCYRIECIC